MSFEPHYFTTYLIYGLILYFLLYFAALYFKYLINIELTLVNKHQNLKMNHYTRKNR